MTNWITESLLQTVVYWEKPTPNGYGGYTFGDPVELSARWEDKTELFYDSSQHEIYSRCVVYLTQDVDIGGWLYLGSTDDFVAGTEPTSIDGALEIRGFRKIPDVDDTSIAERKAWLQ